MSNEHKHIDHIIKDKLAGFEMTPPADVWAKTEAAIAPNSTRKGLWLWFLLGGIVLITTGGLIYYGTTSESSESNQTLVAQKNNVQANTSNSSKQNGVDQNESNQKIANSKSEDLFEQNAGAGASSSNSRNNGGLTSRRNSSSSGRTQSTPRGGSPSKGGKSGALPVDNGENSNGNGGENAIPSDGKNDELNASGEIGEESPKNGSDATPGSFYAANNFLVGSLAKSPFAPLEHSIAKNPYSSNLVGDGKPPRLHRFSLDLSAGISTFRINASEVVDSSNLNEIIQNATSKQLGTDFRLGVNYQLNNMFSIQTGIEYNRMREEVKFWDEGLVTVTDIDTIGFEIDTVTFDTTYITSTISFDTMGIVQYTFSGRYEMLSIPFNVAWTKNFGRRSAIELAAGGSISIWGSNGSVTPTNTPLGYVYNELTYKRAGLLSLNLSAKYMYRIRERHQIYVEPWVRFGISNQSIESFFPTHRNQYGIRFGYRFTF